MKKKNIKPLVLSSLAALSLGSMSVAGTFALFTDQAETTINIGAAEVSVKNAMTIEDAYSLNLLDANVVADGKKSATYVNGGDVEITDDANGQTTEVEIKKWTPGDGVKLRSAPVNGSNVSIKVRLKVVISGPLAPALVMRVYEAGGSAVICAATGERTLVTGWLDVAPNFNPTAFDLDVRFPDHDNGEIKFGDENKDNKYQGKAATIKVSYEAVQGNADVSANLLERINTMLATNEVKDGKNVNMYEAVNDLAVADVATLAQIKANNYVWGAAEDLFYEANGVTSGQEYKYFKVYEAANVPAKADQTFSIYADGSGWTSLELKGVGFDAGSVVGMTAVSYEGAASAREIIIRTNGGSLTINDTNAGSKQIHYGTLANAEITTGSDCFYTHGKIAYMDLKQGKAVADNGGIVALMKAASGTEAEKINGGIIYIPDGTSNSDIELTSENLTTLGYVVENEKINATAATKAANVYEISSKAELVAFRDSWNKGEVTAIVPFKLTANIDISGENWTPIGNWKYPFNGIFDGNGKTISGLTAVGTLASNGVYNIGGTIGFGECYGFIGIVGEGNTEVKDLTFTNVNINLVNGKNVGVVIGFAPALNKGYDGDTIDSVGTLTLSGVTVSGSVNANAHVGGLVGDSRTTGDVTFENCVNNANITSTLAGQTGGIIGCINTCSVLTMNSCKNNGNITVTGTGPQGVAGLVGRASGASLSVTITDCESNGNITSALSVAGVIDSQGQALNSLIISNTKVTGVIISTGASDAHVLYGIPTGDNTTLTNNTFTGVLEANKDAETTQKNAKLDSVVAPDGYEIASIYKAQAWGDPTIYHDANGDKYFWNNVVNAHPVGYVVYDTEAEWTQIENTNVEYKAVGDTGYYVFRVNGSDIYARYTENPETDYRALSQHPNHGQYVVAN